MTISDPIADMLTRIRNATMARHDSVLVSSSKLKMSIARILKEEGFIKDYEIVREDSHKNIKIFIKYQERNQPVLTGLERVSKPGLRIYVEKKRFPRLRWYGDSHTFHPEGCNDRASGLATGDWGRTLMLRMVNRSKLYV